MSRRVDDCINAPSLYEDGFEADGRGEIGRCAGVNSFSESSDSIPAGRPRANALGRMNQSR